MARIVVPPGRQGHRPGGGALAEVPGGDARKVHPPGGWEDRGMCGRYVVAYDPETLVSGFSVVRVPPFPKRWNVAPQSEVPVVHETREGERVVTLMRWGLLPHWARDPSLGNKLNNARAESVFDKPSFRQAVRRRRCLLPASGFYEWQAGPSGKQPWYISRRDGTPFAMAGLFEAWRASESDEWRLTCCVITTEPNALMAPIHDRMPVMIEAQDWSRWLARDQQEATEVAPLLRPCDPAAMQAWPVSRAVNRGSAEGPELPVPIPVIS